MELEKGTVVIVDDDRDVLETARIFLKQKFSRVETMESPGKIIALLEQEDVEAVLLDMNFRKGEMDGVEGIHWLKKIKSLSPFTTVVMITAYGDVKLAVEAMKEGASDFVIKPWKNEKLYGTIKAAIELSKSRSDYQKLKGVHEKVESGINQAFSEIVGQSPGMRRMYELIEKVGPTDANVLILGENGTGKELAARALHRVSDRNQEVFLRLDLGAITPTLFESELFGHVKGAFTDAKSDRPGSFELARKGTLFLDEIGNLPLQAKLLTAIQNREVRRVGSNKVIPLDIRLICATNMDLKVMTEKGEFRKDLLYRINTVEIHMPPLRERAEDLPILIDHFLKIYGSKYHKTDARFNKVQLKKLASYPWPGNIRELQHTVERAIILSEGKSIPDHLFNAPERRIAGQELYTLEEMEKRTIERSININRGNLSKVAAELGITRATLYRKLERYGLE
ncbi:MAG TPA: sigma-54 dependent transcriptional regulator [Cyclobacteriaceae bacterium]|nr:sigma-54 dependent transcriptional regulator [Cyclobacteriaceae bacterium]